MNDFSSTENSGLLKNYYDESPLSRALREKRKKLALTKKIEALGEEEVQDQMSEEDEL